MAVDDMGNSNIPTLDASHLSYAFEKARIKQPKLIWNQLVIYGIL